MTFDGKLEIAGCKVEHAHRTVARPRLVAQAQRLDQLAVNIDGFVTTISLTEAMLLSRVDWP